MSQMYGAGVAPRQLVKIVIFYFVFILLAFGIALSHPDMSIYTSIQFAVSRAGWPAGSMEGSNRYLWSLFLGNIALYGAFALVVFSGLRERILRWNNRWRAHSHSVICGLGWQGKAYIENLSRQSDQKLIAIDKTPDDGVLGFCEKRNCRLYVGDAFDESELLDSGVHNASYAFVCTGSQDENLSVAQKILSLTRDRRAQKHKDPLKLYIAISGDLRDHSFGGQILDSVSVPDDKVFPMLYSADNLTARIFFHRHRVYEWAHLWRQPRVHLVFIGFTAIACELILQYARIHPFRQQRSPLFTIICRQAAVPTYRQMRVQHPIFQHLDGIDLNAPSLEDTVSLPEPLDKLNRGIHCGFVGCTVVEDDHELLSERLMRRVSRLSEVTAVITCHEDTEKNFDRAVQVRNLINRYNRWRVPLFVHAPYHTGLAKVLEPSVVDASPARRVIPFGSPREHCDLQLLQRMDDWARAIHDDYISLSVKIDKEAANLPANRPWELLSSEHRMANYRAADHIVVKMADMGYRWHGDLPERAIDGVLANDLLGNLDELHQQIAKLNYDSEDLRALDQARVQLGELEQAEEGQSDLQQMQELKSKIENLQSRKDHLNLLALQQRVRDLHPLPPHVEAVAEREHESWCLERLVMGYSYNEVRDDRLLHHPKLVSWVQLLETDKTKDHRHLQVIRKVVPTCESIPSNRGNRIYTRSNLDVIARLPLRLALVGGYKSSAKELTACAEGIQSCAFGRWLWSLVQDRWIEMMTPLNTGAEIRMASEIAHRFGQPGCCCDKRACPHLIRNGCDYRLLIPSNLPWHIHDDQLQKEWQKDAGWYETSFNYDSQRPGRSKTNWGLYRKVIMDKRSDVLDSALGRAEIVDLTTSGWREAQLREMPVEAARTEVYRWILDRADVIITNDRDQACDLFDDQNLEFVPIENTPLYSYRKTLCADLIGRAHGDKACP